MRQLRWERLRPASASGKQARDVGEPERLIFYTQNFPKKMLLGNKCRRLSKRWVAMKFFILVRHV